jgi:predicted DNA-binding protein (UPF0251 family)
VPRPRRCRWVWARPNSTYFKPRGIPLAVLDETVLTVDEHEAIRLADLEGLEQEQAAQRMNISRQTFGRILASARKKIADAIINAKAIRIQGGDFVMAGGMLGCGDCGYTWQLASGTPGPPTCPSCGSPNVCPADADLGYGLRGRRRGWGGGKGGGGRFRGGRGY